MNHSLKTFDSIHECLRIIQREVDLDIYNLKYSIKIDQRLTQTCDKLYEVLKTLENEKVLIKSQKEFFKLKHIMNTDKPYVIKTLPYMIEQIQLAIIQMQDIKEEKEVISDTDRRINKMCLEIKYMQKNLTKMRNQLEKLQKVTSELQMVEKR